jgi:hypothetical protein
LQEENSINNQKDNRNVTIDPNLKDNIKKEIIAEIKQ